MIIMKNVTRSFKNGSDTVEILKNINLTISENEFLSIMGPSGSGKSTLINILGFVDREYTGEYYFRNENFKEISDDKIAFIRNKTVGFVFQNFKLIQNNTVFENVEIPLIYSNRSKKDRKKLIKNVLQSVGLEGKENMLPKNLSGGQQQRVAIARSIVNNPDLLIADEPTGALDTETSKEIMDIFIDLNSKFNTTIVLVTHDYEVAKKTKRIINIIDGKIVEKGRSH
ncbi:TPA: ABC transporter ATP-binding protein [Staphylococcus aureus]|uniref:Putative hemin import ATP-binding protein HrtA n=1 Tax=Staphylococcus aureus TaxID=1280 RepID=Q8GPI0_STAAU|nr:ABC transporter ATP-binding protein [Staphylococcus aureus]AAN71838.1 putative ABC transporter ATP-binding protein [Staphylococcus aureus]MBH4491737.1 ABC transporter ATP-binding protein [Staphylococcus aureus]MBU7113474.1 ABC transporter ATP-binding protein [Staphylococcus aureus]MBZ8163143.1 ABC transporter ATP-binding protein [Staphylococcus aureus]MBZ8165890.1 ABC transporter ATP-binding protein [Staphylococcus aureus]